MGEIIGALPRRPRLRTAIGEAWLNAGEGA